MLVLHNTSDISHQNNISHIFGINSCCQHLRACQNYWNICIIILKSFQKISSNFSFITCHSHTIIRICNCFIFIYSISHTKCMPLIYTKNNGFIKFIYLIQNHFSNQIRPFLQNNIFIHIFDIINIFLCFSRNNGVRRLQYKFIDIKLNSLDFKRSQKTIIYSRFETVFIHRLSKIFISVSVFLSFWSGCHPDLHSTIKIFQNLSPISIFLGSTTMTLINNNGIKKIFLVFFKIFFFQNFLLSIIIRKISSCQSLINCKEKIGIFWNFTSSFFDFFSINFFIIFFKIIKCVHSLIYKHISISQKKYFWPSFPNSIKRPFCLKKFVTNLKSYHRFSSACSQIEQNSIFSFSYSLHRFLNRYFLVISRFFV